MKVCTRCGEEKPLDGFPRNKRNRDGHHGWCKPCHAAKERERRLRDPEVARAKDRVAYLKKGPRAAAKAREYREKNQDAVRARDRARYVANRDARLADMRDRKLRRGRTEATYEFAKVVLSDPCAYCGGLADTVDHIVPFADGGLDEWENMTGACRSCNGGKAKRPLLVFLAHRNGCWEYRQDVSHAA